MSTQPPSRAARIVDALVGLDTLADLPRTGWLQHGVAVPESIAGHTVGVAHVALALAPRVEPALDVDRVVLGAVGSLRGVEAGVVGGGSAVDLDRDRAQWCL